MDFFGIGTSELLVILLVALLVLGPNRMMQFARDLGRFWREAQQTIRYAIDTAMTEDTSKSAPAAPPSEPLSGPEDAVSRTSAEAASDVPHEMPSSGEQALADGCVATDGTQQPGGGIPEGLQVQRGPLSDTGEAMRG